MRLRFRATTDLQVDMPNTILLKGPADLISSRRSLETCWRCLHQKSLARLAETRRELSCADVLRKAPSAAWPDQDYTVLTRRLFAARQQQIISTKGSSCWRAASDLMLLPFFGSIWLQLLCQCIWHFIILASFDFIVEASSVGCCWCCRSLQSDVSNDKLPGDLVAAAFRQMCQAAILHWWGSSRQQALYTNSLLNFGNEQLKTFEKAAQGGTASTVSGSQQADAFWAVAPSLTTLLALNYPKAALPADFQPGMQSSDSHRRSDASKRLLPDANVSSHQHHKRAKAGSSRSRGEGVGGRRRSQAPELSNKLQKRLATVLELVAADAPSAGPPTFKQVCTHVATLPLLLTSNHVCCTAHYSWPNLKCHDLD